MRRPSSLEPTRYELVMEYDGKKYLVCYSMRTGRQALFAALHDRADAVFRVGGLPHDAAVVFQKPARCGAMFGHWRVYWTGRTQRQAISEGELPFVMSVEVPA